MHKYNMLIADDSDFNKAILRKIFSAEYQIAEASDGVEALAYIKSHGGELSVVLLDILMPNLDGFGVLRSMSQLKLIDAIPVVIITAYGNPNNEERCLEMGACDIINKPFSAGTITRRVRNVVQAHQHRDKLKKLARDLSVRLQRSFSNIVDTLSTIIENRNLESGQHITRTRLYTKVLLKELAASNPSYGLDSAAIETISSAAALHDVGKIVIPDAILNKPGRLTAEEFDVMKKHAAEGGVIVKHLGDGQHEDYLSYAYEIAFCHHERWDGKGYPRGLRGDDIPLCAQVTGIVDVYDALTTRRVYKPAYTHEKAIGMIMNGECGAFSDDILRCFMKASPELRRLAGEYSDDAAAELSPTGSEGCGRRPAEESEVPREKSSPFYEFLRDCGELFFIADLESGRIYCSNRGIKEFPSEFTVSFSELMDSAALNVHHDDCYKFRKQVMLIESGIECGGIDFRWRAADDVYRVIHEEAHLYRDMEGNERYAIGLLSAAGQQRR